MSVEQLQYELQKADREFRSKGQAVQAPTTAQIAARTDVAVSRSSEPEIPEEPKSESTVEAEVKKEVVEEKVVTLSSSSKRNKVVSFKKREKASANFKERSKDD